MNDNEILTEKSMQRHVTKNKIKAIIAKHDERKDSVVGTVSRSEFYDEARKAYAIIATSEKALYANVLLQKGVL